MTLIITYINRHGIIHASDSNLTSGNDKNVGEGKKTYEINFLNAGLTIAGSYNVGNIPMDKWMPDFIETQSKIDSLDLKSFSNNLKDSLQSTMTKNEKESGSIIHIAGYVEENGVSHPEFGLLEMFIKWTLKQGLMRTLMKILKLQKIFGQEII